MPVKKRVDSRRLLETQFLSGGTILYEAVDLPPGAAEPHLTLI
jgi:hypothetical protein